MEARQSESTQQSEQPNVTTQEEVERQLQGYAEEYRERIEDITSETTFSGVNVFDTVYDQLTNLSVTCMTLYIRLRYLEDFIQERIEYTDEVEYADEEE